MLQSNWLETTQRFICCKLWFIGLAGCKKRCGIRKKEHKDLFVVTMIWIGWYAVREPGARFSKDPETFWARRQIFKIKTCWIVTQFLSHKPFSFISSADSFIVLFSKLLKLTLVLNENTTNTKQFSGSEKLPDFRETGSRKLGFVCCGNLDLFIYIGLAECGIRKSV